MPSQPRKTVYRNSGSGQFTTKKYAENHPRTTEKERVIIPKPAPKGK